MRKVMKKIFIETWKMILKVFLKRKIPGDIYRWNIWAVFLERTWRGSLEKYLAVFLETIWGDHWGNIRRIFWGGF
jgi:hypothetical protein